MRRYVRVYAQNCLNCQRSEVSRHVHLAPATIAIPHRRFEHVHVDIVGPLPQSSGFSYLFTVVDRTTRWPEAIPLSNIATVDCAAALFTGWIQRFGVPAVITSFCGPCCALSSQSTTSRQLPTIPSLTGWLSDFIAALRKRCGHGWRLLTGCSIFPGFSWV
jgi:hypothetical protein